MNKNQKSSLTVVGSGIKCISHLTVETIAYIEQSSKVLYLVNEPAIEEWIQDKNPESESLSPIYSKYNNRDESYKAITKYILNDLQKNKHLCVVLYGHPTVFAQPALDAVIQAKRLNYDAKILPGISSEDCLFADLLVDPGTTGCQSFDATDFLLYKRQFDVSCHLILWQAGVIGTINHVKQHCNQYGATQLYRYLKEFYDSQHIVILYEAALYPHMQPVIVEFPLKDMPNIEFMRLSTMYISPAIKKAPSQTMLNNFNLQATH